MNERSRLILCNSFDENFKEGQEDKDYFLPIFNKVLEKLPDLPIEEAFVDVSRKLGGIDFNIVLENKVSISIMEMEELGNDAYYSIANEHKIIEIGWMKLDDIIKKIICQI